MYKERKHWAIRRGLHRTSSYTEQTFVISCTDDKTLLHFMESKKQAKAFGKGTGFGVFLFLLGPIARLVLGFGSAQYQGNPER